MQPKALYAPTLTSFDLWSSQVAVHDFHTTHHLMWGTQGEDHHCNGHGNDCWGGAYLEDARHGHGCGPGHEAAHQCGQPSQDEVDACTHNTKTFYHCNEYNYLTPTEKQKVWQLKNPRKIPEWGQALTQAKHNSTSSCMSEVSSQNRPPASDSDDDKDLLPLDSSNSDQENSALAHQTKCQAMRNWLHDILCLIRTIYVKI